MLVGAPWLLTSRELPQSNPFSTKMRSLPGSPAASVISASHGLMRGASNSGGLPAQSLGASGGGRTPRSVARRSADGTSLLGRRAAKGSGGAPPADQFRPASSCATLIDVVSAGVQWKFSRPPAARQN